MAASAIIVATAARFEVGCQSGAGGGAVINKSS